MATLTQANDGKNFLQGNQDSPWTTMVEVMQDRSNAALLRQLDCLLSDKALLTEVASRSHRHQLGFVKIVLLTDDFGRSLRLHVWDLPSMQVEDIHSHCASFSSRVISGGLSENSYELTPGNEYVQFRYSFDMAMGCSVARADGTANAALVQSRLMSSGNMYVKKANEMHNVTNVELGTITVSAWESRNTEALVLKSDAAASAKDCEIPVGMMEGELLEILLDVKERVMFR